MNFVGSFNYIPDPIEYNEGSIYKNLSEGVAYIRKGLLWEELVRDGKPGRDAARVGGSGVGVAEVNYVAGKINTSFGSRMVVIGDSQTACDTAFTNNPYQSFQNSSWTTFMAIESAGRIRLLRNVAIGGQTSKQMLDRFQQDVLSLDPDIVVIAASINDGNLPNKQDDGIKNHIAMIELCSRYRSDRCPNGVKVILTTTPPTSTFENNNSSLADRTLISKYNQWKEEYCRTNNLPLIDFNYFYSDPQGSYKLGATIDGVHPTIDPWQKDSGVFAWNSIKNYYNFSPILLPKINTDPLNIFTNGMLYPAKSGVPAGFGAYGESSQTTTVEAVSGHRGMCVKCVNTGSSNRYIDSPAMDVTPYRGKRIRVSFTGSGKAFSFKWVGGFYNNSAAFVVSPIQSFSTAEFICEVVVPNDATGIYFQCAAAQGMTTYFSSIGVYEISSVSL